MSQKEISAFNQATEEDDAAGTFLNYTERQEEAQRVIESLKISTDKYDVSVSDTGKTIISTLQNIDNQADKTTQKFKSADEAIAQFQKNS